MKIKVKDEMNDIRLKLNHREFMTIFNNLVWSYYRPDIKEENRKLFDCQEFKNEKEYFKLLDKIVGKMAEVEDSIDVW